MAWKYLPLAEDNKYNDNLSLTNQNFEQLRNFLGKRTLTISKTGTLTVTASTVAGTDYSGSVTHDFNYVPSVFCMAKNPSDSKWYPVPHIFSTWSAPNWLSKCKLWYKVDTTTLTLYVSVDGTATYAGDWIFRYYIFEEDVT